MSKSVRTAAILVAHDGKAEALRSLLGGMVSPSRAEAGNLQYDLWRDKAEPDRFLLDEAYTDGAALEAHRATPHYKNYLANISDLADRTLLLLGPIDVA